MRSRGRAEGTQRDHLSPGKPWAWWPDVLSIDSHWGSQDSESLGVRVRPWVNTGGRGDPTDPRPCRQPWAVPGRNEHLARHFDFGIQVSEILGTWDKGQGLMSAEGKMSGPWWTKVRALRQD